METISFDEMSTLDVPSAALRSSLDKIASALQKVGAAGTDASAAVDELRTSLRAAAAQSVKSARSLAKFDEINRLSAPAAEKADAEKTTAAAKKTGGSTRKSGSRSGSRAKAEADGEVSIWQAALQTLRDAWDGFWLYLQTYYGPAIAAWQAAWEQIKQTALAVWEPVRAAALSMGGNAVTATALQAATMLVFDLVLRLTESLLVPAVCVYLAVTVVDAAAGNGMLRGLADGVGSLTAGALKLMLTLFTAYLAVAGGVSGNVDRLALKTAKFAVSGAVPVVGGVMSDAAETVLSGASLLRGSVGVFGMVCVTAICLAPFVRAGACCLCFKLGAALLSPLCSASLRRLLSGIGSGFALLLGMLGASCTILYLELVYAVAMVKPI